MGQIELAEIIATEAHIGQVDKGGNPYICHPATVASLVETQDEKIVAWLHDIVEDTTVTLEDLRKFGFTDEIIDAVNAITRRQGESRKDYLNRVKQNPIAIQVKIADLKHNSDISRIPNPTSKDYERVKRYKREINELRRYRNGKFKGIWQR